MKTTNRIVSILWISIGAHFFATLVQGIFEMRPNRSDTLGIHLFFVFLFLAGMVTSFFVLLGARWARVALSLVALLAVSASVMGLFASFDSLPFSFVGIAFDIFAIASACVLLFGRKHAVP
jgi:hypothetical protein